MATKTWCGLENLPTKQVSQCQVSYITVVREGRWEHISLHLLYCAMQLFVRISLDSSAGYLLTSRALSELQQAARSTSWLSRPGVCWLLPDTAQWWGLAAPFSPSVFVSREGSRHAVFTKDIFAVLFWFIFVNYQGGCMLGKTGSITGDSIKANQREKQQYESTLPSLKDNFVLIFE